MIAFRPLVALFMAALLAMAGPSSGVAAGAGGHWVVICRGGETAIVLLNAEGDPVDGGHCPDCLPVAAKALLAPMLGGVALLPRLVQSRVRPALPCRTVRGVPSVRARAPPGSVQDQAYEYLGQEMKNADQPNPARSDGTGRCHAGVC